MVDQLITNNSNTRKKTRKTLSSKAGLVLPVHKYIQAIRNYKRGIVTRVAMSNGIAIT